MKLNLTNPDRRLPLPHRVKNHEASLLEEGIDESFPASDPVSIPSRNVPDAPVNRDTDKTTSADSSLPPDLPLPADERNRKS